MRGIAYKRVQREKHIKRKENILRAYRLDNPPHRYNYKDLFSNISFASRDEESWIPYFVKTRGYLNKGKIHCSCQMCSAKTRKRNRYGTILNYKPSDLRRVQQMDWDEFH